MICQTLLWSAVMNQWTPCAQQRDSRGTSVKYKGVKLAVIFCSFELCFLVSFLFCGGFCEQTFPVRKVVAKGWYWRHRSGAVGQVMGWRVTLGNLVHKSRGASVFGEMFRPLAGFTGQQDSPWNCCYLEIQTGIVSGFSWMRFSFLCCLQSFIRLHPLLKTNAPLFSEQAGLVWLGVLTLFLQPWRSLPCTLAVPPWSPCRAPRTQDFLVLLLALLGSPLGFSDLYLSLCLSGELSFILWIYRCCMVFIFYT